MLIQDIVPPKQVVILREYFVSVPRHDRSASAPAAKTSKASKPKAAHAHKVKVH